MEEEKKVHWFLCKVQGICCDYKKKKILKHSSLGNYKWWEPSNDSPRGQLLRHDAHGLLSLPREKFRVMKCTALLQAGISLPSFNPSIWFGAWITPLGKANPAKYQHCSECGKTFGCFCKLRHAYMHQIYFLCTGRNTGERENTLEFY